MAKMQKKRLRLLGIISKKISDRREGQVKYLQKIGKSLMIPIACMPVCGILMGIGYLLCPAGMQGGEITGFIQKLGYYLCTAGGAVINHMPILFAIGVGIGMADGEGNGGIAALVSWLMILTLLSSDTISTFFPKIAENEIMLLAFSKIENPFIGILAGLIGAHCILKFKNTRLPSWLSFFSGKRLGIIISGLVSIAVSALLVFIWPFLFSGLVFFGRKISDLGDFGSAIYVTLNRLLIPFGLHHALNDVFWFDLIGIGDLTTFWAGKTSIDAGWSVGMYMSGFFPSMMFGVPAAALAMKKNFRRENHQASGMLMSAAATSFLCGVTEPFEFMFMFVSPALYVLYALLYGIFTYIANICGFRAGFSFSGGLIDLIFSASLPAAEKTLLIIPLGIGAFIVYYFVFSFMIRKFDLKTPGREESDSIENGSAETTVTAVKGETERAVGIIKGLGGSGNIVSVSNCATRLRLEVRDNSLIDEKVIKKAGAVGVMKMGQTAVQVIIGMDVEFAAEEIRKQLASGTIEADERKAEAPLPSEYMPAVLRGKTGNRGTAVGRIYLKPETIRSEKRPVDDIGGETARFVNVLHQVRAALCKTAESADINAKDILEAQVLMLEDETFIESIRKKIEAGINADYAVFEAGNETADIFEAMPDAYLKARASDVRNIAEKLRLSLLGFENREVIDFPCIYVADELTPEEMTKLDKDCVLGIVTNRGSANSHTSILAGNYGIPYLYGVDFDRIKVGKAAEAALDADNGILTLDPDEEIKKKLRDRKKAEEAVLSAADSYSGKVKVYANIGGPEDVGEVLDNGADGIGLFRTEFLYMNRSTLPSEEEQFEAYKKVLEDMDGREVVIRTMDIGADKQTDCLRLPAEENPALGKRAIRICLEDTDLFRTQLRAILRAAVYGNPYIMYPMIASADEVDAAKEQVRIAAQELDDRQVKYRIPPQGIMIETPAAAVISDLLAEKADFFSIGTNDLCQYTTALDRQAEGMERFYHPNHEAVLRLMALTVKNAHEKGIWVGVCGEMGGDPEIMPRLCEMGVDELSMSPQKVRKAKAVLTSLLKEEVQTPDGRRTETGSAPETLGAPADGFLIPMEEIKDEVFSSGALGKCIGILPENGNIYAPCSGTVTMIAETLHAVGLRSDSGRDILIHVGIDTVTLGGKGFDCRVQVGDTVKADELIMTADLKYIEKAGLDPTVIVAAAD